MSDTTRKSDHTPISADRADVIRERFARIAAERRAQADEAERNGDHDTAAALRNIAESQERMAAKRYERMTIVGAL
jgi:DNA-binding ferritin-like protein